MRGRLLLLYNMNAWQAEHAGAISCIPHSIADRNIMLLKYFWWCFSKVVLEDLHVAQQVAKESHQALEERVQKLLSCKTFVRVNLDLCVDDAKAATVLQAQFPKNLLNRQHLHNGRGFWSMLSRHSPPILVQSLHLPSWRKSLKM